MSNVVGLLDLLHRLKLEGSAIAFRGQSRSWPLIPELGRRPFLLQGKGYDNWIDFEDDLLDQYKKYAYPFVSTILKNDWDWLFSARHHGLPTRLLDWSSSPLKGLFFAVQDFRHDSRESVLWVLEAACWMESMANEQRRDLKDMVLTFPSHLNERIIAQDSCFTVFPLPKKKVGFIAADQARLVRRAVRVIIPAKHRQSLRRELASLGFSHRTMFPGLDGIAASIRQEFGEGWLS